MYGARIEFWIDLIMWLRETYLQCPPLAPLLVGYVLYAILNLTIIKKPHRSDDAQLTDLQNKLES